MISAEQHAKRKKRLSFILFLFVTMGVLLGGLIVAIKNTPTFSGAIDYWFNDILKKGLYIPWVGSFLIWIYFRVKYTAEFKK